MSLLSTAHTRNDYAKGLTEMNFEGDDLKKVVKLGVGDTVTTKKVVRKLRRKHFCCSVGGSFRFAPALTPSQYKFNFQ